VYFTLLAHEVGYTIRCLILRSQGFQRAAIIVCDDLYYSTTTIFSPMRLFVNSLFVFEKSRTSKIRLAVDMINIIVRTVWKTQRWWSGYIARNLFLTLMVDVLNHVWSRLFINMFLIVYYLIYDQVLTNAFPNKTMFKNKRFTVLLS